MTREVALGLLSVANTGNDILAVLDVIQGDVQSDNEGDAVSYITGKSVTFWLLHSGEAVLDSLLHRCYNFRVTYRRTVRLTVACKVLQLCKHNSTTMEDTIFDLFSEIADAPGEIFDIPEMSDQKFDVEEYINSDTDYW